MAFKYMDNNRELTLLERLYFPEVFRGMGVTLRHFVRNALGRKDTPTRKYPEARFPMSYRARNRHYLTHRSDGRLACVACQMCSFACPAKCIRIEIGELDESYYTERQKVDRYPKSFTIDQLLCIYCGFCVEACPEDAIRMDSGLPMLAGYERATFQIPIQDLANPPESKHERVYNPLPGLEPALAPLEVIDPEKVKKREY